MKRYVLLLSCLCFTALASAPSEAEEQYFDSDGTNIRFTITGTGPPVILVHGFTASGDLNWRLPGVVHKLEDAYRVITMDVRGHGKSDEAKDGAYGMAAVHDVVRLMDHLEIEKAHVAGYSMGGMIAIKLMTEFPDRLLSAIVGGMGWMTPGSIGSPDNYRSDLKEKFRAVYLGFAEYETTEAEMKAIRTPMVVIVGTEDAGQLRRVKEWQEIVPDLPVQYVEDAQHANCVFKPQFRDQIRAFFDSQP